MQTKSIDAINEFFMREKNLLEPKFHKYNSNGEIIEISLEEYEKGLTRKEIIQNLNFAKKSVAKGKTYDNEAVFGKILKNNR